MSSLMVFVLCMRCEEGWVPGVQMVALETLKYMLMWASLNVMGLADGFSLEYGRREINDEQGI